MYGTDGKLLSGIPIHEIGTVKRGDIDKKSPQSRANANKTLDSMPFGKHKGESFDAIPKEYRKWMLDSFEWHGGNMNLKLAIEASL